MSIKIEEDADLAIPGVEIRDVNSTRHRFEDLANNRNDWEKLFHDTRKILVDFIKNRDAISVLCKSATYYIIQQGGDHSKNQEASYALEQADIEMLHALTVIYGGRNSIVPTAPRQYERIWDIISKSLFAFSRMQASDHESSASASAIARVRLHTIYYRNSFSREDCERLMREILAKIDEKSLSELSFSLLESFEMLMTLVAQIEQRISIFCEHYKTLFSESDPKEIHGSFEFLESLSPLSRKLIKLVLKKDLTLQKKRELAFQILDASHAWIYTLKKSEIIKNFGEIYLNFLNDLSLPLGGFSPADPNHIYMSNPIWSRPFIVLPSGDFVLPEPYLFFSFPFRIFQPFIEKSSPLKVAYEKSRATFLEDRIAKIISTSLPSAQVYKNASWMDHRNGMRFENDVVAVLGSNIFLFEAKSGRLDDAGRRGALKSLKENLRDLYVEPGEQAYRLQRYLAECKDKVEFFLEDGSTVTINLDRPKLVHRYSIAMEHYASLTSGKRSYVELGLISDTSVWSPVLSIGDLEILSKFLDTEVSFFHYLTRRSNLEDLISVTGDELDFLSLYLQNGFSIDYEALKGKQIGFSNLDVVIRTQKIPRDDRKSPEVVGGFLPRYWKGFLREIYDSKFQNRFDIIEILLNQKPEKLLSLEKLIQRWRSGLLGSSKEKTIMIHNELGKRVFLFSIQFRKHAPSENEWISIARYISYAEGRERIGATDCVTALLLKKSKSSYDYVSFHRYLNPDDMHSAVGGTLFGVVPNPPGNADG